MAQASILYQATLQISDMQRNYYAEQRLLLPRHASETEERLMVRTLAYALHADEDLKFASELCDPDKPDFWLCLPDGRIQLWLQVGLPEFKLIQKACAQASQVVIYAFGKTSEMWWQSVAPQVKKFKQLQVWHIAQAHSESLPALCQRKMNLTVMREDDDLYLSDEANNLTLNLLRWQ